MDLHGEDCDRCGQQRDAQEVSSLQKDKDRRCHQRSRWRRRARRRRCAANAPYGQASHQIETKFRCADGGSHACDGKHSRMTLSCRQTWPHKSRRLGVPLLEQVYAKDNEPKSSKACLMTRVRRGGSKKAGAWRSLRRLVAQAVGNLAAWRKGRTNPHASTFNPHDCLHLVARPRPGTQAGTFHHRRLSDTPDTMQSPAGVGQIWAGGPCLSSSVKRNKQSMLRLQIRRVAGGTGRRKQARARQAPGTPSPRPALSTASTVGSPGQICLSRKTADLVAVMDGRVQGKRQAACRPGDPLPRPALEKVDDVCKLAWDTTASTPRLFYSSLSNCECASSTCSWSSRPSWSGPCAGHT